MTAQRRAEGQQDPPLAVTVISGDALQNRGVRDLNNLQNVSPVFSFADVGISKFANICGIGLNLQSPTVVVGVALYRDSLFATSPIFLAEAVFDIALIEVLREPQGTFVGQNSTGGPIIGVLADRTLVNSQLQYHHNRWTATVFGTNIFDKTYRSGNDGDSTWYGAPRQYGVRVGVTL